MFEKGVGTVLETMWVDQVSNKGKEKPVFRALMVASTSEHTDKFYGNAYVTSKCQTFVEATTVGAVHGSMLFTKQDDGKLKFGIAPEQPIGEKVVFADMVGHLVDSNISQKITFKELLNQQTGLGSDLNVKTISVDKPFTDSISASVNSIRELCGQRISPKDWDEWMDNMYGRELPDLKQPPASFPASEKQHRKQHLFDLPGRVMRVIVTFHNAESASEVRVPANCSKSQMHACVLPVHTLTQGTH